MSLKMDDLRQIVDRALSEERVVVALKEEISRELGSSVVTEGRIGSVARAANDRLDVLDRTGRSNLLAFNPDVAGKFLDYADPEVRRFAARIVPESYLSQMVNDRCPAVRSAVAHRVSLNTVRDMIKRFPKDDQLRSILRTRKLHEGIAQPKTEPMGHDPCKDAKRMSDTARTSQGPELSAEWYRGQAERFIHDYNQNIEGGWEELAVKRFCSSTKATSGVEIDAEKLLKAVNDLLGEQEERSLERNALKETLAWLTGQEESEMLSENLDISLDEGVDPVLALVGSGTSGDAFVDEMKYLFDIREAMIPTAFSRQRMLDEGDAHQVMMPVHATMPHGGAPRAVDERALDKLCEIWTRRQARNPALVLSWAEHPSRADRVSFTCSMK